MLITRCVNIIVAFQQPTDDSFSSFNLMFVKNFCSSI